MKRVTREMIQIWNVKNFDWLGYELKKGDYLSYHHIVPKRDNGKMSVDNGALLSGKISHPYIHLIEAKDIEIYSYINNMLKTINNQRYMPTRQQLLAIDSVFRQFEREYCGKKTAKGNELIIEEYTKRLKIDKIY